MKSEQQEGRDQLMEKLPILERLECLVQATEKPHLLFNAAEKSAVISTSEKEILLKQFGSSIQAQLSAFYLLLNSKQCSSDKVWTMFNASGNEKLVSVLQEEEEDEDDKVGLAEREQWNRLQKIIKENIERLSSHTMNLGLVLCFASGIGLISGKDREIIANSSTLEIDQLKKFYLTVSQKKADAYAKLLNVLKMTNNNWTLDVLQIHFTD